MNLFRHEHRWRAIAAQEVSVPEYEGLFGGKRAAYVGSAVLYACKCGEHKTETFPGRWDLSTLRGKSAGDVASAFLSTVKP